MLGLLTRGLTAAALIGVGALALRAEAGTAVMRATFAAVGATTSVPYGWADFCRRYRSECDDGRLPAQDLELTETAWRELKRVNEWVNANIEPVSDMEHWGVEDQWDYPTDGKGDCEDYALLKRKLLMERGLPRQALLMTVVREKSGEGHAVLTVRTSRGDYVLDNQRSDILPWAQTGYRFVKRQSQEDPNIWVSIGEGGPAPLTVSR